GLERLAGDLERAVAGGLHAVLDQQGDAALGIRGGKDHAADLGFAGMDRGARRPGGLVRGPARQAGGEHAPLELAQVLRAGDDLLARVATLAEPDAADQLVVDHLGDPGFTGGRGDPGHAREHLQPAIDLGRRRGEPLAEPCRGIGRPAGRAGEDPPRDRLARDRNRRQAEHAGLPVPGDPARGRGLEAELRDRFGSGMAVGAQHAHGIATVVDPHLGPQHVHGEPPGSVREIVPAREQAKAVRRAREQERRVEPALRRAVAADADPLGRDRGNVAGQLRLQEGLGLRALGVEAAPMGQQRDTAAGDRREAGRPGSRGGFVRHHRYYRKSPDSSTRMKRLLLALVVVVAAAAAAAGWLWHQYGHAPIPLASEPTVVTIARGSGGIAIARQLREAGVDVEPMLLRAALRLRGDGSRMQAGTYRIEAGTTLERLLDRLVAGDVILEEVRIVEGWTFRQLRAA